MPLAKACLILIYCLTALSLIDAHNLVPHDRGILEKKDKVIEYKEGDDISALISDAKEGSVIELLDNINLNIILKINVDGLIIRGKSEVNKPIIKCTTDDASIEISSKDVVFENVVIRECASPAIKLSVVDGKYSVTTFRGVDILHNGKETEFYRILSGGGIYVGYKAMAIIENCLFQGNTAIDGGAIYVDAGYLIVDNSLFIENSASTSGGAITARADSGDYNRPEAIFKVSNSIFKNNSDTSGGVDMMGLMMSNGAPLETSEFLSFSTPQTSGGAIYVSDYGMVNITSCIFEGNTAVPSAGALFVADNKEIIIDSCMFVENLAISDQSRRRDYDIELGGAVYVAFVDPQSSLIVQNCVFEKNKASYGGGMHIVTPIINDILLDNVTFAKNTAYLGGGGLTLRNTLQIKVRYAKFFENIATAGGGALFTNGAGAQFEQGIDKNRDVIFQDNIALDGGGIFFLGAGQVSTKRLQFYHNRAERNGGGVCMIESLAKGAIDFYLGIFSENKAERGGAIFMDSVAKLDIVGFKDDHITFINNKALAGGAVYARTSSQVINSVNIRQSNFEGNEALNSFSDLYHPGEIKTPEMSSLSFSNRKLFFDKLTESEANGISLLNTRRENPCLPGGGGGICVVLSEVPERASVLFKISESNFTGNTASTGGGIFVATKPGDVWSNNCQSLSTSESLVKDPCRGFNLQEIFLESNFAKGAGGAIFATNADNVHISSELQLFDQRNFTTLSNYVDQELIRNNMVGEEGYGNDFASNAVSIKSRLPTRRFNGVDLSVVGQASGESLPKIELEVIDAFGHVVSNGIEDSKLKVTVHSNDGIVAGQLVSIAEKGLVTFDSLTVTGEPKVYMLEFRVEPIDIKKEDQSISIRRCNIGEFNITQKNICTRCEKDSYSFDPEVPCEPCPLNANCTGGPAMIPVKGYWHSTPFSPQLHRCLFYKACNYENRTDKLLSYFKDENELRPSPNFQPYHRYPQCNEGYTDVLCASCEDGYGHMPGGECQKCQNKSLTALIVSLVAIWTLFLLGFTIRSALASIRDMRDMQTILAQSGGVISDSNSGLSITTNASKMQESPSEALANIYSQGKNFANVLSMSRQHSTEDKLPCTLGSPLSARTFNSDRFIADMPFQTSIDHIVAAETVSETIKIAVNYLQLTSVAVGINVEWTTTVKNMLSSQNTVSGFSKGSSLAPLTCLLPNSVNRSLQGVVVRIAFPLILMLIVIVLFFFNWLRLRTYENKDFSYFKSRTVICVLVVLFFSYECITEELMRIFSCIDLDAAYRPGDLEEKYHAYSIARDSYWVEDSCLLCFKGPHKILVTFLGIPGILFFSLGIPLFIFVFLLYKRERGKLLDQDFLNTYGFIYQNYTAKFVYWEVCIMIRKACIGGIVVFAYGLGANLQGVMALGSLIIALVLHLVATPFKHRVLNILESFSLLVSIFTFYSGIVFNDEKTSDSAKVLLSLILVFTNLLLVVMFVWRVYVGCDKFVTAKLRLFKVRDIPGNFPARAFKLGTVVVVRATEQVQQTINASRFAKSLTLKRIESKINNKNALEGISESSAESSGISNSSGPKNNDSNTDI